MCKRHWGAHTQRVGHLGILGEDGHRFPEDSKCVDTFTSDGKPSQFQGDKFLLSETLGLWHFVLASQRTRENSFFGKVFGWSVWSFFAQGF